MAYKEENTIEILLKESMVFFVCECFRGLQALIGKNSNNLNQIAKRVNTTEIIYREDIDDLKKENDNISKEIMKIQNILVRKHIKQLLTGVKRFNV